MDISSGTATHNARSTLWTVAVALIALVAIPLARANLPLKPNNLMKLSLGLVLRSRRRYCAGPGRLSAPHIGMEIPQAPLGHHWEDSTHILSNVFTAGVSVRWLRFEASGFHGAEPGENRWTIPFGPIIRIPAGSP